MAKMTKEDLASARKKAEAQDGLTKIFTTFGMWWDQLIGKFKEGFLKGFKPLFDSVGDFTTAKNSRHSPKRLESGAKRLVKAWASSSSGSSTAISETKLTAA
jgi:hypothetical protein